MKNGFLGVWLGFLLAGNILFGQEPGIADSSKAADNDRPGGTQVNMPTPPIAECSCVQDECCGWDPCGGDPERFYASADYLLWWIKDSRIPTLVVNQFGPGGITSNGGPVDNEERSGGRFNFGYWLGDAGNLAVEIGYLFLGSRGVTVNNSASAALLDPVEGTTYASGNVPVLLTSRFQGAEANLVANLARNQSFQWDALVGFRWLQLVEAANVNPKQSVQLRGDENGTLVIYQSNIHASNDFYGGQIGTRAFYNFGALVANLTAKLAFGGTHEILDVQNQNQAINTQVTNIVTTIGGIHRDRFAVVPEVGFNIGYDLTSRLRINLGYTFLDISSLTRPGDATVTNGLAANNQVQYSATARSSDFWAQGLNLGMLFHY
jgi:hypothetical protein